MIKRKVTGVINIGEIKIGGNFPVVVQSMTKTDTRDIKATVFQIKSLGEAGCEIARLAIPDREASEAFGEIKKQVKIPLIADIHFDYRLAVDTLKRGADGLRINPGNIGSRDRVEKIVSEAKKRAVPIRIGVNSGSIEKNILKKYGHPTPEAIVESALNHVRMIEDMDFNLLKLSLKSSDVMTSVESYRLISKKLDYPLHLGITEAGSSFAGTIKSSVGLGILLSEGIGDTIRVSLTAPPEEEIPVAYEILRSLGLRKRGIDIISCPTCGRCEVKLFEVEKYIREKTSHIKTPLTVAIMGCVVNGPGEAKEADVGIAAGKGSAVLFKKGEIYKKISEEEMGDILLAEIISMSGNKNLVSF